MMYYLIQHGFILSIHPQSALVSKLFWLRCYKDQHRKPASCEHTKLKCEETALQGT